MSETSYICKKCTSSFDVPSINTHAWRFECGCSICSHCHVEWTLKGNSCHHCPVCKLQSENVIHSYYTVKRRGLKKEEKIFKDKNNDSITFKNYSIPLKKRRNAQEKDALKEVFAILHQSMLAENDSNIVSGKGTLESQLETLAESDDSELNCCLFALASGKMDKTNTTINMKCIIYSAAENIRRAIDVRGSPLRSLMSRACITFSCAQDRLQSMFQKIGSCYSRQNSAKHAIKQVEDLKGQLLDNCESQ